ncbi:MAG: hypothetical protein JWM10_5203 [Myxococcaceae bacterium]|nr:hypothetical protein [Myxococcaceae bacterium]
MKNPIFFPLALVTLAVACVNVAEAQPTHHPRTPVGVRSVQWVVHRSPSYTGATCVGTLGCEAPRSVARCAPGGAAPLAVAQAIGQRLRLTGQTVAVRGHLDAGGTVCTEARCHNHTCCNRCGMRMSLTATADGSVLGLWLGAFTDSIFACDGDDSGFCCGTVMSSGDVVARGVLRVAPGDGGGLLIESPTLCTAD